MSILPKGCPNIGELEVKRLLAPIKFAAATKLSGPEPLDLGMNHGHEGVVRARQGGDFAENRRGDLVGRQRTVGGDRVPALIARRPSAHQMSGLAVTPVPEQPSADAAIQ